MKRDEFGNRMKSQEGRESDRTLIPQLPALARLDGKCFHSFTKDMERPYDERFINLMVATTKWLVEETNACFGYTQSDEISLAWYEPDYRSQIFFGGRIMKMTSVLASMATLIFNNSLQQFFGEPYGYMLKQKFPLFDCRVWNVPNIDEGANVFLWREKDATRNSIQMAAQHHYSYKELMNKNTSELQEMLFQKGVNWSKYPSEFKRGTFIQRRKRFDKMTVEDIEKLPEHHEARKNPELNVERTEFRKLEMPPFGKVLNQTEVIFFGEDPITMEAKDYGEDSQSRELADGAEKLNQIMSI